MKMKRKEEEEGGSKTGCFGGDYDDHDYSTKTMRKKTIHTRSHSLLDDDDDRRRETARN